MDERFTIYAPERDIYRLLQVDPRSGADDIVAACRRLARYYHPDYNVSPRAHEQMQVVNTVRRMMTNPAARARYDLSRQRYLALQAASRWPTARPAAMRPPPLVVPRRTRPMGPPLLGLGASVRSLRGQVEALAEPARRLRTQGRALLVALRVGLTSLAPPRCPVCRAVNDLEDRFCASCGTPRLAATRTGAG